MTDATTATVPSQNPHPQSNPRGRRRRGGNAGVRRVPQQSVQNISQDVLALRPASVAPLPSQHSSADPSSAEQSATERTGSGRHNTPRTRRGGTTGDGRGRHENRSSRGGRAGFANNQTHVAGRRQFGGQLTVAEPENGGDSQSQAEASGSAGLRADASEFVPGQQHRNRHRKARQPPPTHAPGPRPRAGSIAKSNAEDIMTRTHEDIASGVYECLICSESIHRRSKVWSCHTCWAVLHLHCIRKWSSNEAATVSTGRLQDGELPPPRQWRCPGCNLPQDLEPGSFTCWCGKENDPSSIPGLPPHSCGQSCSKEKTRPRKCPHACDLVCHAGPCPPCTAMGPEISCFCGKTSAQKRCVETNYDEGWSCGQICDELLPCGDPDHTCQRPCHEGLCGACEVPLEAKCYCGQVEKTILCNDKDTEKQSRLMSHDGVLDEWTGMFRCNNACGRLLDCGVHSCEMACHSQGNGNDHHCPRSIDVVSFCTCGKTPLKELGVVRSSCEDPIPACDKVCGKALACGHSCNKVCHVGDCPPCSRSVGIDCICGRTSGSSICHQGLEAKPQCARLCRTTLNCGRHACENRCCSGEKKASERTSSKRKHRALGSAPTREEFEPEHICVRQCSRQLSCGVPEHVCQELCHKGKCNTCPNAIFHEVSCHCGRTVLFPPLPCGTQPPPCRSQCQRPNPCSLHPPVVHNCHGDDEPCPKCPFLTAKKCMCGKKTLKNQPCFSTNVSCGTVCGNLLRCGSHTCRKPCHPPGECEDAEGSCMQACGKPKSKCGHPDLAACHTPSSCSESKPCQSKMVITCDCARLRVETKCLATNSNNGNLNKRLSCDDECARLARNRQLAIALNVDPIEHSNDHVPYETATLRLYQENGKFAIEQEHKFRIFAADDTQRRLRFPPMKKMQRGFLRALATDFGFESESLDPEPHRHVVIFKTPRFVAAPMKTIAECIRIRALQGKLKPVEAASSANASDNDSGLATDERIPFNGFVLSRPRFGLTIDELQHELASSFRLAPSLAFDIAFLPNEEVVLKAKSSSPTTTLAPEIVQSGLKGLKSSISGTVADKKLAAGGVSMCLIDSSMNLMRREQDANSLSSGWSTVAKGLSRQKVLVQPNLANAGSRFLVLGKKKSEKERGREAAAGAAGLGKTVATVEDVADDWEEEMNREEQEEEQQQQQQQQQHLKQEDLLEVSDAELAGTSGAESR